MFLFFSKSATATYCYLKQVQERRRQELGSYPTQWRSTNDLAPWQIQTRGKAASSQWWLWEVPRQWSLLSMTHHPFQNLQRGPRVTADFFSEKHGVSKVAQCFDPQWMCMANAIIGTLSPSLWKLLQEGTLWGQSWGWLPMLLVDYSHLFPSSTKCANHENISQWLACYNPPF